jgi:hypothetical protein
MLKDTCHQEVVFLWIRKGIYSAQIALVPHPLELHGLGRVSIPAQIALVPHPLELHAMKVGEIIARIEPGEQFS